MLPNAIEQKGGAASGPLQRAIRLAGWALPPLLMLWVFRPSLRAWFQQDDFAWLGLTTHMYNWRDLLEAVFLPTVHGTFRPFSERGFFIVFRTVFGLDPFPWRLWVFFTQACSLLLLNTLTRKLTGSAWAGVLAASIWAVHARLTTALSWTSAYMQILCGLCLLGAFYLWLRYVETGERKHLVRLWIVFVFGFGVMESNLVLPALTATHAFFFARRHLRKALALFAPSLVFIALHMHFAPKQTAGPYAIHLGPAIFGSLWQYWSWAVSPVALDGYSMIPEPARLGFLGVTTALLAGFVVWSIRRREWQGPLFGLWFLILLSPVLPLTEHVTDYYVTLALIGFAMLSGTALARAFEAARQRGGWRWVFPAAGVVALAAFLVVSIPVARRASRWFRWRGERAETLVMGVMRARELHPAATILLEGVDQLEFGATICDDAFASMGVTDVLLTPGSDRRLRQETEVCRPEAFTVAPEVAANALDRGMAEVYEVRGRRLKNVTGSYAPPFELPGERKQIRLEIASASAGGFLGPEWPPAYGGIRWMPARATVRMPARASSERTLVLMVRYPEARAAQGPLRLRASVNGRELPERLLEQAGEARLEFPIANDVPQEGALAMVFETRRGEKPVENQLAFGAIELRAR